MANGRLNLGKQSGGVLSISFPDGLSNTEVVFPESGTVVTTTQLALKANTADLKEIGVGQTWQDFTASRLLNTKYTNTTGKPIMISYTPYRDGLIFVNDNEIAKVSTGAVFASYSFIVPNGATYKITDDTMGTHWSELR